ncbi:MAG: PAS domain S-box protein [Spirochaetales bacterium]|nr:PAS domain S-box protein [Spirochaetales bacterium]
MKKPIESQDDLSIIKDLIGMEGDSIQKSYFPQLQQKIEELDREREKYLSVFNNALNGILRITRDGRFYDFNPALSLILKISDKNRSYNFIKDFLSKDRDFEKLLTECSGECVITNRMVNLVRTDGKPIIVSLNAHAIDIDGQEIIEFFMNDISERVTASERLKQSQKMEAIGKLAGGISHDFNNLITSIAGAADMILGDESINKDIRDYCGIIINASEIAADLTSKLLTFSRQEGPGKTVLSLSEVLDQSLAILERTLDKRTHLIKKNLTSRDRVLGNKAELQNCLINMAINGSQAMPRGGNLCLILENCLLDHEQITRLDPDMAEGEYVILHIKDYGTGISREHLPHIFEPFYTTKEEGKGTGLGLATVYGIIKEHRGIIYVESVIGVGTEFSIYLPLYPEE